MTHDYTDYDLLRRFEPVVRYNAGEQFFPMDVEAYAGECGLWVQPKGEAATQLVPDHELTLDMLAGAQADGFDAVLFMTFISPLNVAEMAQYRIQESLRRKDPREVFHAGRGRLARVGYVSRILDALFSLTLLARGRVPGDNAAAAALTYRQIMERDDHACYYGRVVRQDGWIALQYWFFYAYNNWRSGFFGVNDHESDWEQVIIYCYETVDGDVQPEWVAYASHDFHGDDLRRRWDDSEVDKIGEHPVIHAGAGSHASYFQAGEYLTEIEIPYLRPLVNLADWFNRARQKAFARYYQGEQIEQVASSVNLFHIPFVDYARGDGFAIGPEQEREWSRVFVIDPPPGWVGGYRGLWGLYTRDPLSGEDAPAGPMYNRDGTVRRAWYDPVGWAGLDKVAPPGLALDQLYTQQAIVRARSEETERMVAVKSAELVQLGTEALAMRGHPHLKAQYDRHLEQIHALSAEVGELRGELTRDAALLDALDQHVARLQDGDKGPLRGHIQHAQHPASTQEKQISRIAEFWAAASIGLMLIAFVVVVIFRRESLWTALATTLGLFIVIEAAFRRRLGQVVTIVTIALAVIAAAILLSTFFWPIITVAVLVMGGYMLWENLRELWS